MLIEQNVYHFHCFLKSWNTYLSMVRTPFACAHARATRKHTQKLVKYTWQSYAGVAGRGRVELGAQHARPQHRPKTTPSAARRRPLEPCRQNGARRRKSIMHNTQVHDASALQSRGARATRSRDPACLNASQKQGIKIWTRPRPAHRPKHAHERKSTTLSRQLHTACDLRRRGARATRNARARGLCASADLTLTTAISRAIYQNMYDMFTGF
jgi:hypothetical protein